MFRCLAALALASVLTISCTAPDRTLPSGQTTEQAAREVAQGVTDQRWPGVTSTIISLKGETLAEAYAAEVSETSLHDVRSATKSVTALLVGQALDEREGGTVDMRAADLLPERFKHMAANDPRRELTLRDLLTMRTGLACDDWVPASTGNEDKMYETEDWVGFFLSQPQAHDIGQHFSYCTGGVLLLGEIIEALSGQPVSDFAAEHLFDPLDIRNAQWAETPEGGTDTGGHLNITTKDFHKIGLLMLGQGAVGDEIVVPQEWWEDVTGYQTDVYERRSTYGYLWWRDVLPVGQDGDRTDFYYAHGNGGNFIFVVPEFEFVATFTGQNFGSRSQFQPVEILRDILGPSLDQ